MDDISKYKKKVENQVKKELPKKGRGGDTVLAHLTVGEMVIPAALLDAEGGAFRAIVSEVMQELGINPKEFTVGDKANKINPETGYPEFGWFSNFIRNPIKTVTNTVKKVVKKAVKVARDVVKTTTDAVGLTRDAPEAPEVVTSSTAAAARYQEDPTGKSTKTAALRAKRRGKRRLRVSGDIGIGTTGQGSGVGTGGASGGTSVNVPRG